MAIFSAMRIDGFPWCLGDALDKCLDTLKMQGDGISRFLGPTHGGSIAVGRQGRN